MTPEILGWISFLIVWAIKIYWSGYQRGMRDGTAIERAEAVRRATTARRAERRKP